VVQGRTYLTEETGKVEKMQVGQGIVGMGEGRAPFCGYILINGLR